ncbi:MAG TPA: AAA family ATPase [Actinomycetota bacterium]|nr:AAA family ATPase [Actinomycetota bacterium]
MPAVRDGPLLEREAELHRVDDLLGSAEQEAGQVALIEGPAGIGKTELLKETLAAGRRRGFQVFGARAGELEQGLPFGVVRQLFELPLARSIDRSVLTGPAEQATRLLTLGDVRGEPVGSPPDQFALVHGLYWLCLNLAERGPVLIAVDDVHWADEASLGWLAYLVRRIEDQPVAVALALRSPHPVAESSVLRDIRAHPFTATLPLEPLSESAAASLVRATFPDAAEEFCRACHHVTAGNPFFLRELVAALRAEGVPPTASESERVRQMAPGTITHVVLLRLGALPPPALDVARAIAVFGARAEVRHAAALADLDVEQAAEAADALVAAGILNEGRPLEFVHPVVRTAIYGDIPPGARAAAHARAARILASDRVPPDRVAGHVLLTEPAHDAWAVEALRAAARWLADAGAPAGAIPYLRRALAEPPPEVRADVLFELGSLEVMVGDRNAADRLQECLEASQDRRRRAEIALLLGRASAGSSYAEAVQTFQRAIDELGEDEREVRLRLEAELLAVARWEPTLRSLVRERLPRVAAEASRGETSAERRLLGFLAQETALLNEPAEEARRWAEKALAGGLLLAEEGSDSRLYHYATDALTLTGAYERADRASAEALEDARSRGSFAGFARVAFSRVLLNMHRGHISDAEVDARAAIQSAEQSGARILFVPAAGFLAEALVERGDVEGAEEVLREAASTPDFENNPAAFIALAARGRWFMAVGRTVEALEDLSRTARLGERFDVVTPAVVPWRSLTAVALATRGAPEEARQLVAEELALARAFGAPRPIGIALRAQGLVERGEEGLALLRESVSALEGSGADLEHARSLTDLGAALRRANRRSEAREPLRRGAEMAFRCGATALFERAQAELKATGARPRRVVLHGVDSLTASERRVAAMASGGMTNREIAQALFVSVKTVEKHLGQAYAKLGVSSRAELKNVLKGHGR